MAEVTPSLRRAVEALHTAGIRDGDSYQQLVDRLIAEEHAAAAARRLCAYCGHPLGVHAFAGGDATVAAAPCAGCPDGTCTPPQEGER